jgi:hypothetical protein
MTLEKQSKSCFSVAQQTDAYFSASRRQNHKIFENTPDINTPKAHLTLPSTPCPPSQPSSPKIAPHLLPRLPPGTGTQQPASQPTPPSPLTNCSTSGPQHPPFFPQAPHHQSTYRDLDNRLLGKETNCSCGMHCTYTHTYAAAAVAVPHAGQECDVAVLCVCDCVAVGGFSRWWNRMVWRAVVAVVTGEEKREGRRLRARLRRGVGGEWSFVDDIHHMAPLSLTARAVNSFISPPEW